MSALLTYRSRNSFEARFGRNAPDPSRKQTINGSRQPLKPSNEHWAVHNDGHKNAGLARPGSRNGIASQEPSTSTSTTVTDPQFSGARPVNPSSPSVGATTPITPNFSAQSYLRYQGAKFVYRFDSNCYIAITRKLDTHDVSRHRSAPDSPDPVADALGRITQPTLVIGIQSDGLFTFAEQQVIAAGIPDSRLRTIDSTEGHDAFLLQFEQVNAHILAFLREVLPDIMEAPETGSEGGMVGEGVGRLPKSSTFGEAEVEDITAW